MLPQRYQRLITHDINRILRELAGPNDKKDTPGVHTPSSPMAPMHHSQGAVAPLTLDSPQTLIAGSTTLTRENSNPDYNSEMELPPKGIFFFFTFIVAVSYSTNLNAHAKPTVALTFLA